MPDIFLSYNREDAAIARAFAEGFAREGLSVWWDATLRSGEAYDKVTEAALREAKAVVVLWSPRSVESRWVRAEATIADRNGTLMPVTIEPCERPVMFELTQTADLSHWRGDAAATAWMAFLDDVRRMVGRGSIDPAVASRDPAPIPDPVPAASGAPVVAVLPLTHRAGDEEIELLAEDMTEEITRELAQIRYFKVIAAGTMAAWRGKATDYRALGRELGARYLIEGKLQRGGEDIRLTVQLIDAGSASTVWSQRFVRKAEDIAASPEEFPVAAAAELCEQILVIERNRAISKPGPHSAWEHLFRAMAHWSQPAPDSLRSAIEETRSAIAAAPDIGLAHAILGTELAVQVTLHAEPLGDALRCEIQAHAKRAMQLDGANPMVIQFLVTAYVALGEGETSLRLARRAVELTPHSTGSYDALGIANLALGRTADAIAAFTEQDRLSSFDNGRPYGLAHLGMCYLLEGQPAEAEEAIDRALALYPDFHLALKWKAIIAAHRGEEHLALATVQRLRAVEPAMSIDKHVRQMVQNRHLAERSAKAVATLRRLWDETGGAV